MTRHIECAMDEYLAAANSLEQWDLSPEQAEPVLQALRTTRRR
jgi:hypothetical protein